MRVRCPNCRNVWSWKVDACPACGCAETPVPVPPTN